MKKGEKNKVKGICGTLLFHAVLLFLLSLPFMSLKYEDPPIRKEGEGGSVGFSGIAINVSSNSNTANSPVQEEKKTIENEDLLTSEEGELIVKDEEEVVKNEEELIVEEEKEEEELSDGEVVEYMKNDTSKTTDEDINSSEYEGEQSDGEEGGGGGFGDGLDWDNNRGREGTDTLLCSQGKGTGYITVNTIIDAAGNIVEIDEESFFSKIVGIDNLTSSDTQIEKLLKCIKEEYKVTASTGKDKSNKLYFLRIDFTN